jgi:chromate transporter
MKLYFELFWSFLKIGSFTFGGGYSMLPLMRKEIVLSREWATEDEVIGLYALSQVTPGAIAVNAAVFLGFKKAGWRGGVCAACGVVLPSFVVISVIAAFLANFSDLEPVKHAFTGIRVAVAALILDALLTMTKAIKREIVPVIIASVTFAASAVFDASPVLLVFSAGVAGFFLLGRRKKL